MPSVLSIDFGTSFTAAAIRRGDQPPALIDIDGDARFRTPSCVAWDSSSGRVIAGRAALNGRRDGAEFQRTPKRLIKKPGVLWGGNLVSTTDLIAAVLERVMVKARKIDHEPPPLLRLTHPAQWGQVDLAVLRAAAAKARASVGWEAVEVDFMSEPQAAAIQAVASRNEYVPVGGRLAVYDLGGGTFDAAVVERTEAGFRRVGNAVGLDPCGGEDFDELLLDLLGERLRDRFKEWPRLRDPPRDDIGLIRASLTLRDAIVELKENLSNSEYEDLEIPRLDHREQITQEKFEGLIGTRIEQTAQELFAVIEGAKQVKGLNGAEFVGVTMTGGSSHIPLVERLIEGADLPIFTEPDRKGVVALGAARDMPPPPVPNGEGTIKIEPRKRGWRRRPEPVTPIEKEPVDEETGGDSAAVEPPAGETATGDATRTTNETATGDATRTTNETATVDATGTAGEPTVDRPEPRTGRDHRTTVLGIVATLGALSVIASDVLLHEAFKYGTLGFDIIVCAPIAAITVIGWRTERRGLFVLRAGLLTFLAGEQLSVYSYYPVSHNSWKIWLAVVGSTVGATAAIAASSRLRSALSGTPDNPRTPGERTAERIAIGGCAVTAGSLFLHHTWPWAQYAYLGPSAWGDPSKRYPVVVTVACIGIALLLLLGRSRRGAGFACIAAAGLVGVLAPEVLDDYLHLPFAPWLQIAAVMVVVLSTAVVARVLRE